jgi:hypothetical protein
MAMCFDRSSADPGTCCMQKTVPVLLALLLPCAAWAVVPLVTDDADPVDYGRLQFNSGLQFSRTA